MFDGEERDREKDEEGFDAPFDGHDVSSGSGGGMGFALHNHHYHISHHHHSTTATSSKTNHHSNVQCNRPLSVSSGVKHKMDSHDILTSDSHGVNVTATGPSKRTMMIFKPNIRYILLTLPNSI